MKKLTLSINGMEGVQSESIIVNRLKTVDGVLLVNIDVNNGIGLITLDDKVEPQVVVDAIQSLGYAVADNTWRKASTAISLVLTCTVFVALITFFVYTITQL